jgi:hypothetical protein
MLLRVPIILLLVLSFLFGGKVGASTGMAPVKLPQCATMVCVKGCCQDMACCQASKESAPQQPAQVPASPRSGIDMAMLALTHTPLVYELPPQEMTWMRRMGSSERHALPPLVAICIRLI